MKIMIFFLICLFTYNFQLKAQAINPVKDLPMQLTQTKGSLDILVIYLTGDGGWNNFNQQLTEQFEKQGYGTIALNTRKYFWNEKSPQVFAHDIEQLSNYYMKAWQKSFLIIVGYSFGADVAIFLPELLSIDLQQKIKKIVLISPSASTDFVVKLSDMIGEGDNANRKYKVKTEIEKTELPVICIFGNDEELILKSSLKKNKNLTIQKLPGDHRYNNNFALLSETIWK